MPKESFPLQRSKSCCVVPCDFQVKSASSYRHTRLLLADESRPSKLKMCALARFWQNGVPHQSFLALTPLFSQKEPRVSMVRVWVAEPQPRNIVPEFSRSPSAGALIVTSFAWKFMRPYLPSMPLVGITPPVQLAGSL